MPKMNYGSSEPVRGVLHDQNKVKANPGMGGSISRTVKIGK